jgi:hypothetical protein
VHEASNDKRRCGLTPILLSVRRRGRVKDLPSSVSRTCWIGQQDCIEQTRLQYGNVGRT